MSEQSDFTASTQEPTRAFLLAQALEQCIRAERRMPGSSGQIVARQPAWARAELRRLLALTAQLDATAARAAMSDDFRHSARARLLRRIGGHVVADWSQPRFGLVSTLPSRNGHNVQRRRRSGWLWRGGLGGLLAAVLAIAATLTASANALPGQPLYGVKQAREELNVRLAPDDQARTLALLAQANARLDETARLLDDGRTAQAAETTQRFDDALGRATTTYVVTMASDAEDRASAHMEVQLSQQQAELQDMLQTAPEPARSDLREALVATQRSRALVADAQPATVAIASAPAPSDGVASAQSTMAAEALPTDVPQVQAQVHVSAPPPIDLVANSPEAAPVSVHENDHSVDLQATIAKPPAVVAPGRGSSRGGSNNASRGESVVVSQPASVASVESSDDGDHDDRSAAHEDVPVVADRHDEAPQASSTDDHGSGQSDTHDRVVQLTTPVPEAREPEPAEVVAGTNNSSGVRGSSQATNAVAATNQSRNAPQSNPSANTQPANASASTPSSSASTNTQPSGAVATTNQSTHASTTSSAAAASHDNGTNTHGQSSSGDDHQSSSSSDGKGSGSSSSGTTSNSTGSSGSGSSGGGNGAHEH